MGIIVCPSCQAEGEQVELDQVKILATYQTRPIKVYFSCPRCRSTWERGKLGQMVRMGKVSSD